MAKGSYYHIEGSFTKKRNKWWIAVLFIFVLFIGGAYGFLLTQSPNLTVGSQVVTSEENKYKNTNTNFVKIEKLGVVLPLDENTKKVWVNDGVTPQSDEALTIGGLRFGLGLTPQATKKNSPFYHLNKMTEGDIVTVYFDGSEYNYRVVKVTSGRPSDVMVEKHKLVLYTTDQLGNADGTATVEAEPIFENTSKNSDATATPLL